MKYIATISWIIAMAFYFYGLPNISILWLMLSVISINARIDKIK